jgi:hypothetical protein
MAEVHRDMRMFNDQLLRESLKKALKSEEDPFEFVCPNMIQLSWCINVDLSSPLSVKAEMIGTCDRVYMMIKKHLHGCRRCRTTFLKEKAIRRKQIQ